MEPLMTLAMTVYRNMLIKSIRLKQSDARWIVLVRTVTNRSEVNWTLFLSMNYVALLKKKKSLNKFQDFLGNPRISPIRNFRNEISNVKLYLRLRRNRIKFPRENEFSSSKKIFSLTVLRSLFEYSLIVSLNFGIFSENVSVIRGMFPPHCCWTISINFDVRYLYKGMFHNQIVFEL